MTEAEWLTATNPMPMLEFLFGKASERKLRLFACACCRNIWDLLTDEASRRVVEIVEGVADGMISKLQLPLANDNMMAAIRTHLFGPPYAAASTAHLLPHGVRNACYHAACRIGDNIGVSLSEQNRQCQIMHDIFGNPFRPLALNPSWLTSTVVALASGIYADRAFDRLPILADALQDAGCENPDILAHCRSDGPHARGCWVVDLLLKRE